MSCHFAEINIIMGYKNCSPMEEKSMVGGHTRHKGNRESLGIKRIDT